jgi:hypothetical protein
LRSPVAHLLAQGQGLFMTADEVGGAGKLVQQAHLVDTLLGTFDCCQSFSAKGHRPGWLEIRRPSS